MTPYAKAQVNIPGKIMLCGEYAVLWGAPCLASTVSQYLTVEAQANNDNIIIIKSQIWAKPIQGTRVTLKTSPWALEPLVKVVLQACECFNLNGVQISVTCDFSIASGLGSSSALRIGVFFACFLLIRDKTFLFEKTSNSLTKEAWDLVHQAYILQKEEQSFASGYDLVTQSFGGPISWRFNGISRDTWPGKVTPLKIDFTLIKDKLHFFHGGKGAPTKKLVSLTMEDNAFNKEELTQVSLDVYHSFLAFLINPEISELFTNILATIQKLRNFFSQKINYPDIAKQLDQLPHINQTWGFKPTGAGGEDSLILLGEKENLVDAFLVLQKEGWYPWEGFYMGYDHIKGHQWLSV